MQENARDQRLGSLSEERGLQAGYCDYRGVELREFDRGL